MASPGRFVNRARKPTGRGLSEPTSFPRGHARLESSGRAEVASDAPWLSESQDQLTLNPGQQATVTVTLNGGDASVTQPGTYTTGLQVSDDTPYDTSPVNVTMNVTPPKSWGKITGTVSGKACAGTTAPLAGASVQINGTAANYTLKTDSNGKYQYWIDKSDNPLKVITTLDSWQPQAVSKNIKAGQTISANFTLSPVSC